MENEASKKQIRTTIDSFKRKWPKWKDWLETANKKQNAMENEGVKRVLRDSVSRR